MAAAYCTIKETYTVYFAYKDHFGTEKKDHLEPKGLLQSVLLTPLSFLFYERRFYTVNCYRN